MLIEEKELKLANEGLIKLTIYKPELEQNVKGIVLINHGIAEHIERYNEFINYLVNHDYIVYGHNHRGHKGSISRYDEYGYVHTSDAFHTLVCDTFVILEMAKNEYPNLPIFLFGHSMGSFIVQRFSQLYGNKIDGIILCASAKQPTILLNFGIILANLICKFRGNRYRSKMIHKLMLGKFNKPFKPNRTKVDWLNTIEEEVDKYIADPYCGGIFTVSFYRDFLKGLKAINKNFQAIPKDLPILIISGSNDPVGGQGKLVKKLYKTLINENIKNIQLKLYENARHEILLDYCKFTVMEDCINWLNGIISCI